MGGVRFGPQKIGVEGDYKRAQPHADEQIGESLVPGPRRPEGTHRSSHQRNDQRSPQVPLLLDLFVVALALHGYRDFVVDLFEVPFLNRYQAYHCV